VRAELRRITGRRFFISQQVRSGGPSVAAASPSHGRGWQARCAQRSPRLTRTRFLGGSAHTRTRHARAPIVMIESDKTTGMTTQQPENSTQDCLDCRLSDMLNTSSSVRYAPIQTILSPFPARYVILHAFVLGKKSRHRWYREHFIHLPCKFTTIAFIWGFFFAS
jgi:hypothetical protein